MKDPQQELYTAMFQAMTQAGLRVYAGAIPGPETPYPFVYLGETQQVDDTWLKDSVIGTVYLTANIWDSSARHRGDVSRIAAKIRELSYHLTRTENFTWMPDSLNLRIMDDTTTDQPLLHGVADVGMRYSPIK